MDFLQKLFATLTQAGVTISGLYPVASGLIALFAELHPEIAQQYTPEVVKAAIDEYAKQIDERAATREELKDIDPEESGNDGQD